MAHLKSYDGKSIQYTAGVDIKAGDVVFLNHTRGMVGIAATDIDNGKTGAVAVQGIFEVAVGSGSAALSIGDQFKLENDDGVFTVVDTASTGDPNVAVENGRVVSAGVASGTVLIRLF